MDIQTRDNSAIGGASGSNNAGVTSPPAGQDVNAFNKAMGSEGAGCTNCPGCPSCSGGKQDAGNSPLNDPKVKEMLTQVVQLLQQLMQQIGNPKGGSIAGPDGGVNPVEGTGPGGSVPAGDGTIPKPTEHIQEINLGGKTVTVGGDGTSSQAEVAETARSMEQMYQNSPTFKNMIDSSSDQSVEVTVGKRSDNTSWGASDGRIFMNTNNIAPGNSDAWQSLLAHEVAHASIDIGHGAEIESIEDKVAQEA